MTAPGPILCPSSRCEPGAVLLGIVGPDGRVGLLEEALELNESFVVEARQGRAPERRMRFAAPCVRNQCKQWTGTKCGVVDSVLEQMPQPDEATPLPRCSIRPTCRWFLQAGGAACGVCVWVITELREDLEESGSAEIPETEPVHGTA